MRRRRLLVLGAAVVLAPVVVLAVEVQLARTAPRLDDEDGFRPEDLVVRAGPDPQHVVWLGDSTAAGVGADAVGSTMAHRVAVGLTDGPLRLTVLARSGARAGDVVDHQLDDLVRTRADVVLVSVGANDVTHLTGVSAFGEAYRSIVRTIESSLPDADVVLVGIPDLGTAPRLAVPLRQIAGWRGDRLDDEIEAIARERDVLHVDLADRTGPTFASDPGRLFAADHYHPSSAGHEVWAEAVLDAVGDGRAAGSLGS